MFHRGLVGEEGHVGHHERVLHGAADGRRMMQHLAHADGQSGVIAKHRRREGVAHEDELDAAFVHDAGCGVVVGRKAGNLLLSFGCPDFARSPTCHVGPPDDFGKTSHEGARLTQKRAAMVCA